MIIELPPEMSVVMFEFSSAKKIPLDPPLTKGDIFHAGLFPLFEKACPEPFGYAQDRLRRREGLGEIFNYGKRRLIRP